jgi:hypothetical protein
MTITNSGKTNIYLKWNNNGYEVGIEIEPGETRDCSFVPPTAERCIDHVAPNIFWCEDPCTISENMVQWPSGRAIWTLDASHVTITGP